MRLLNKLLPYALVLAGSGLHLFFYLATLPASEVGAFYWYLGLGMLISVPFGLWTGFSQRGDHPEYMHIWWGVWFATLWFSATVLLCHFGIECKALAVWLDGFVFFIAGDGILFVIVIVFAIFSSWGARLRRRAVDLAGCRGLGTPAEALSHLSVSLTVIVLTLLGILSRTPGIYFES
ncbi:MAG: hypothetical protein QNJ30_25570 [Kiloniellales bacterium]|nr:hypothetical protein [Kiloniellales bacterium]